jgi:transposase InsO family protein
MSRKGNCWDNAPMESASGTLKTELVHRDYMLEMGVPKHIQEDVLGTPSDRALILDEKTIKTYFWGGLPYLDEWKKNKCSRLSDQESKRMRIYSSRIISTSGAEKSHRRTGTTARRDYASHVE